MLFAFLFLLSAVLVAFAFQGVLAFRNQDKPTVSEDGTFYGGRQSASWRRLAGVPPLVLLALGLCVSPASAQTIATQNLGANQVTLNLKSSVAGTGYFTLLPGSGAACGTATQTVAGQDSTGTGARHGSLPLTANTAAGYTVRNLFQSAAYTVCFTPDGSTAPVSSSFSTASAATYAAPLWSAVGAAGFSADTAAYESLSFSPDGTPYLAYQDAGNGNKATVTRFNGSSWEVVGTAGFSADVAYYESLAFSQDGTPYLAYQDAGNGGNATVMRFNGSAWEVVGTAGFSAGPADYESLAFSPDGTPYLAYQGGGSGNKATVQCFNGSSWEVVGTAGFSAGTAVSESLAFSPDGTPYLAYEDVSNGGKATVMRFNGSAWEVVGTAGISADAAADESLSFSPDGTPYLAYQDKTNSNKATVMRFNGSSWEVVGTAGFSAGVAYYESLSLSPDGTPYLAYQDIGNGYNATVMRFNGSSWEVVGAAGFSAGTAYYESLSFSPDGTPYLAYYDTVNGNKATVMKLGNANPSATTGSATDLTSSSTTLNGTVNDNGSATTVTFDYGTDASYGTTVAATTPSGGTVAAGSGSTAVSVDVSGLTANTTYHFRVNATANGRTVNGSDATFATDKATPSVSVWPTASSIVFGQSLASSTLSTGTASVDGTFAWNDNTSVPSSAGTSSYSVLFTPSDTSSYTTVSNTVSVTVAMATPTITTSPIASTVASGSPLSSSVLTGGAASVAGSFSWSAPATVVSSSGSYQVTFTPTDAVDYTTVTGSVNVTAIVTTIGTANLGANQVTLNLKSSVAGTGYFTLLTGSGAACGTATQTAAGQDSTGTAVHHGSLALAANTAGNYTVRNLSQSAAYTVCFTPDGGTAPISNSFSTTSEATYAVPTWSAVGATGLSAGTVYGESLAFSPEGTPYLAYGDGGNGGKATVMRFNGSAWEVVGTAGFSAGAADDESLAFSPDGTPYLAYQDAGNSYKATVMRFNGSSWESDGTAGFSAGEADYESLAFSPDGTPYLAYEDVGNSSKATVMRFNGSSWAAVGTAGFSAGQAKYESLFFSPDGTPYLAYEDVGNSSKATVMRFNGSAWEAVGTAGFSTGGAGYDSLSFSPDGTPYLAYEDLGNSGKATVMRFNGSSWAAVGTAGFSAGVATYESLAFSPDGTPHLAYEDYGNNTNATVMHFNGSAWEVVGTAGFSAGGAANESFSFSLDGTPYLAYYDVVNGDKATVMRLGNAGPSATTGSATALTSSSATLNGTVNDNGIATTVTFDYGIDTSYGTNIAATTGGTIAAGSGSTSVAVDISSLTPNTTYHFRVDATANGVTVNGSDATFTTSQITPTVTVWPTASAITYGQTLASSLLSGGLGSVDGTFAWTTNSTAPNAGTPSYSVTFTPTDTSTYATVTGSVSLTVNKATPTITTLPTASAITYGQTLASSTLSGGVGSVPGAFAWTTSSTAPSIGTPSYSITFTPTDTTDYNTATGTVSVTVNQATQTVTFAQPTSPITYGSTNTIALSATGGASNNPVTFSIASGPGSISGKVLTITGAGTIVINANQGSSANYSAATQVQKSVTVSKASSTLTGPATQPVFVIYGQPGTVPVSIAGQYSGAGITVPGGSINYTITNSSSSTVDAGSLSTASGSVTVPVASTYAPGNYTVTTSYGGDGNYNAATPIISQLQVGQIQPAITWAPASSITYGTTLAGLLTAQAHNSTSTVPGTYSYSINASTVTSSTVLAVGSYTLTVDFAPTDTTTYKTATTSTPLVVNKAAVGPVELVSSVNPLLVQNATELTATVTSSISTPTGTVTFLDGTTPLGSVPLTNGVASLSVNTMAVGTHSITVAYSGDSNFLTATSSAVPELVQDFILNLAGGASQTIFPGGTATYNFNLTPVGGATFPAPVSLSVTGLPTGATYTITPQTIASGSVATPVALSITAPQQTASLGGQKPFGPPLAPIALGILLLPFSKRLRRRANKLTRLVAMLLLLIGGAAGVATLTGCGASNGFFSQPEKSYAVTITATSGSLSHSTTTTLTVQ